MLCSTNSGLGPDEEEEEKKHTIERKMQISKVDETYCVLRYNIWQIEHTSKDNS
jgi:hypothetical protein